MTLDEKLSLLHGARDPNFLGQAGYWPGLPRLGIPSLRLADGPPGVNVNREATGMPAPVGLAATFSTAAARLYGMVTGRDARALGQDMLLSPHVNLVRDPLFRRNHTTLGEDPFLNAGMGAAEIAGIQSQGIMAVVKHLAGYNGSDDVYIDERTLYELYLPAFQAAVEAGVASVMCGYNRINGPWACENSELQNGVLRGLWGFQGFVTSDWGSVHSPRALAKGVDLEMPGRALAGRDGPYFTDALRAAVESGAVPVAAVDRAVGRILGQLERFDLLSGKAPVRPARIDAEADARIVRRIAEQGAVLLKNEAAALPLTAGDLASLAVIGPTAGQLAAGFLGERAFGFESRMVSPLDALRKSAPGARIAYVTGVDLTGAPIPAAALSLEGRTGQALDFAGASALEPGADYSWTGTLTVPADGDYTLMIQPLLSGGSEGGGAIRIDGRQVARTGGPGFGGTGMAAKKWSSLLPTTDGRDNGRGTERLTAGPHRIEITANSTGEGPLAIRFAWITPELRRAALDAAVAAAKSARAAVVFAWNGVGSSFSLPEDQDALIEGVAVANKRTIVVLNTGGAVAMPWKDRVRAILEMWYPGQEGGWATADVLLGRVNPGGRLPVTFPMKLEDCPARASGHPERLGPPQPPPAPGMVYPPGPPVTYSEGIAVGYRWFDQQNIEPLFPFGHGLSYSRFAYSDLAVSRNPRGLEVSFTVRNSGSRNGTEVSQVYVGAVDHPPVPMAPKSLAGFQPIELRPDESRRVSMRVGIQALSYWSIEKHNWVVASGGRRVMIGASSRDIRLEGAVP